MSVLRMSQGSKHVDVGILSVIDGNLLQLLRVKWVPLILFFHFVLYSMYIHGTITSILWGILAKHTFLCK